jgi:hypothetical protein
MAFQRRLTLLFPTVTGLRGDYEGMYSLTPHRESTQMAEILSDVCWRVLNRPASQIEMVDGTAGIGGNTFGFSRLFRKVHAIEVDAKRCALLQHNAAAACTNANVACHHGSVLDLCTPFPLMFLDPPWGGCQYYRTKLLQLQLGGVTLPALLNRWAIRSNRFRPMVVGIKVPRNFAREWFERQLCARAALYSLHTFPKMLLLVVVIS